MFTRTESGLVNKYLFYPEPLVWVEGIDDFVFYQPLLHDLSCRIEVAGGKPECMKLAESVIQYEYPFVVVMDGDYDILVTDGNIKHERVIVLSKYSIENYAFEREVIQAVCAKYVGSEDRIDEIGILFDEIDADIQSRLYDLIVLDVASHTQQLGYDIFPGAPEQIIDLETIRCSPDRISDICDSFRPQIKKAHISQSRVLIETFLKQGRFSDLVNGHFLFGIIRNIVKISVHRIKKRKPHFDNSSLLIILSDELWNIIPTENHRRLMERLRAAVDQAIGLRAMAKL